MVPMSPATIWRKTRNGSFPPAIKISERVTAWNREAVEAWLAAKEAV
jgi:predicted DNA-binding transcriptional regulator AlpA